MIGSKRILHGTLILSFVFVLSGCKSKVKQPTPPPQMPSLPSSKPPSSMPSIPSMPSKPQPSASPPSAQPPSPSKPSSSKPAQSSSSKSKSEEKSKSKGKKGEPGAESEPKETAKEKGDRQQAGEDLQKAGEALQKAGEQISQASGQPGDGDQSDELEPEFPVEETDKTGDQLPDVLMPESDSDSESDELVFEESESSTESSSTSDASEATEIQATASETEIAESESSDSAESGAQAASEAVQAAQEALEEAGIALQTAGQTVSDAQSEEALIEAEQLLSEARIKIILAEQDLSVLSDSEINEQTSKDINAAIDEANVYLVVATQSILNAKTGLPTFPGGNVVGNTDEKGPGGGLDDELEQSLIIFDGEIEAARATIIDSTPAPTGDIVGSPTNRPSGNSTYPEEGEQAGSNDFGDEEEEQMASTKPSAAAPEGIPSAQGDDIVAHQLREAATAETDPKLKEKLWEEYRRYKSGL
jgi:hypothetical protein